VLLTAMTSMAQAAGANRIIASGRIPHPVGDPSRSPEEEFAWRQGVLRQALNTVATPIEKARIFT
jgi:glycine reductase